MKNTVLRFGLISGAILSALLLITLPFQDAIGWEWGAVVGYTTMVLAFLLIFFGVRSYRDTVRGGSVGFGRAWAVGSLIALVSSLCYVVTWQLVYLKYGEEIMAKYQTHMLEQARAAGDSEAALAAKKLEFEQFVVMYNNPAFNAAITLLEPMPVGLIIALVSAGVLSRRRKGQAPGAGGFQSVRTAG